MAAKLSVDDLADLLRKEKLSEDVIKLFESEEIDGEAFLQLESDKQLEDIGITLLDDRAQLLAFISRLRHGDESNEAQSKTEASLTEASTDQKSSTESMFQVTFNVIVSGQSWGWDLDFSELYILFHPRELGELNDCYPWTTQSRDTGDKFFAVKGVLQIPFEVVQKYDLIYYLYAAKASQLNCLQQERIWDVNFWRGNGYRCLEIPASKKKPGGVWEQWDTIVYPDGIATEHGVKVRDRSESRAMGYIAKLFSTDEFGKTSRQIADNPENKELVVETCLGIYLCSYQRKLKTCDIVCTFDIFQLVQDIEQIFNQLQHRLIGHQSKIGILTYAKRDWFSQKLILVMKKWVMSIVHALQEEFIKSTNTRCADGLLLVSTITALCIVHKVVGLDHLSEQDCTAMATLLRECYRPEQETCQAYSVYVENIPTKYRSDVVMPAIKNLALGIINKSNGKNFQWLLFIPLYHFMAGVSYPYEPLPLDKEIQWEFWPELESVRQHPHSESYSEILLNVKDLMKMDYMFTKLMLYMCPYKDLADIFQRADPILSISFYIWYIEKEFSTTKFIDVEVFNQHLSALGMAYVRQDLKNEKIYSVLIKKTYILLEKVLKALTGISENQCQVLQHILDHVLFVISEINEQAVELVGQWIQRVIGYEKFGGESLSQKLIVDEIHIWRVLFTGKKVSTYTSQNFLDHWNATLEQLLEKRIKLVENKAKLVSCLELKEDIPHQVYEVIVRLTIDDLEMSFYYLGNDDLAQYFGSVSKVFSWILTRHVEELAVKETLRKSITIKELVEWKAWSSMLKVASNEQSTLFCSMTNTAKEASKIAYNNLQVFCDQVAAGAVTLNDMKFLKQNEKRVNQLCTAACIKFSSQTWLSRFEKVEEYLEQVQEFHNLLDPAVEDYEALEVELDHVLLKLMKDLYFHWNDTVDCILSFTCCPIIKPGTISILSSLYLFSTNGRTEIFCNAWKKNMSSLISRSNSEFTQENIVEFVWKPAVQFCVELATRLESRKIALSEVKRVFCDYETLADLQSSCESLVKTLHSVQKQLNFNLCACECCTTPEIQQHFKKDAIISQVTLSSDLDWIEKACKQIVQYRLSLECAQVVLTLCDQDHLNLTGCFKSLHDLTKKDSSMLTKFCLCDINSGVKDPLLEDLRVLSIISSDNAKVQCLKSLINCWRLVKWMKNFQSINAFNAYIEMMTLDEAVTETQLSDVRIVANALSKLLFDLPGKACGLKELIEVCDSFCKEESFEQKLQQSQQEIVILIKQHGQQLRMVTAQEVDTLSHDERHQVAEMKLEIDTLKATLSQERLQLARIKQEKSDLESTLLEQSEQLKELKQQQHDMLAESLHQASEKAEESNAIIEDFKSKLSALTTKTRYYKEVYRAEKKDKDRIVEELKSVRNESALATELEAKAKELKSLKEHFSSVSQTLCSHLQEVKNIKGLHKAKEIGRGSYGSVYEVQVNSVPCIAKRVHDILVGRGMEERVSDEDRQAIVKRFEDECKLLSTLHHPNVVQFMGVHYGQEKADISLIMEFMHMDLNQCMRRYSDIPLPYKTSILRDVAYGLAYLHSIPIIHCDLNTGNILLTESLRAKIADLGVSKLFDRKGVLYARSIAPGALDFMPPESFGENPKFNHKLDIFSFGHLILCLTTQKLPHVNDGAITPEDATNGKIQVAKRRESLDRMGDTHPLYSTAVMCLSDKHKNRPTSTELVEKLEDTCKLHPVTQKNPLDAATEKRQEILKLNKEIERLKQLNDTLSTAKARLFDSRKLTTTKQEETVV